MEHRDFDAELPASEPAGTFDLGGRTWRVRAKDDTSIGLLNAFTGDDEGKVTVGPFFRATIHPDDVDQFMTMIEAPDGPLTTRRLSTVMDYIAALALGRPTKPANTSSGGSKPTGRKSAAGSSSRGTRQRRSA